MDVDTMVTALGCSRAVAQRYHVAFNAAMVQAGCTNRNRAAMWCAQTGHETMSLRYMREIWGPTAQQKKYDPASGSSLSRQLGNTQVGDGKKFMGHGAIMVTGRGNHAAVSKWAHGKGYVPTPTYFVDRPDELAGDQFGFVGAVWYWTVARPQINSLCDAAQLEAVTRAINGGVNGLADRRARWNRCLSLGNRILPATSATTVSAASTAVTKPVGPPLDGDVMRYVKTPEPEPGTPKNQWPTERVILAFRPDSGVVKVDHGGRGGWIHLGRWWVRVPHWTANVPIHDPQDHPGIREKDPGVERHVGYGWETAGPTGADMIEIVLSAPDGAVVQYWRTR